VVESASTVDLDLVNARVAAWQDATPCAQLTGYTPPAGGLHYRWPDLPSLTIEQRLHAKLDAVRAFARINSIDRHVVESARATVGIVTAGKAHYDLMEVLRRLDISTETLAQHGVRIYKLGLTYPIEPVRMREFVRGLKEVLVIEEKGPGGRGPAAHHVLQRGGAAGDRRQAGRAMACRWCRPWASCGPRA
jgi:indolepyruvate ferredoxin oxidoreductase